MDTITSHHSEEQTTIEVKGRLDVQAYKEFRSVMENPWSNKKGRRYVLDFSGLTRIETSGLGMLLILHDDVRATEGNLQIIHASPAVSKVLDMANYKQHFQIHNDACAA